MRRFEIKLNDWVGDGLALIAADQGLSTETFIERSLELVCIQLRASITGQKKPKLIKPFKPGEID